MTQVPNDSSSSLKCDVNQLENCGLLAEGAAFVASVNSAHQLTRPPSPVPGSTQRQLVSLYYGGRENRRPQIGFILPPPFETDLAAVTAVLQLVIRRWR